MSRNKQGISRQLTCPGVLILMLASFFLFSTQVQSQELEAYPPLVYNLLGGTSRVSGGLVDVEAADDTYMSFISYPSTSISHTADHPASDVDSLNDVGFHSDFAAQTEGPDSVFDILTEENIGGGNRTLIYKESFEGEWPPKDWSETDNWYQEHDYVLDGAYSADFDGSFSSSSGYLITPSMNCSDAQTLYIEFYWHDNGLVDDDFHLEYYDGSRWDNYQDLNRRDSGDGWHYYSENLTDSQYYVSDFQIRWWANSLGYSQSACVDLVTVQKKIQGTANYQLDLEVQWTDAIYNLSHTSLCIFADVIGSETISLEFWNTTLWGVLLADLTDGWNNVSVTQCLTSQVFTIRFQDQLNTNDTLQDNWNIDLMLLHSWSDDRLIEVEFAGSCKSGEITQVIWIVETCWTSSLVNVTLQLYNYSLGDYPLQGHGYINYASSPTPRNDETRGQTIAINPLQFRNVGGYWKLRIKGSKTLDTDFELKVDLVRYELAPVIPRDVAVLGISLSALKLQAGEIVSINVTVANNGGDIETFNVTIYHNSTQIAVQTVQDLAPGSTQSLEVNWDTTNVAQGFYMIRATADVFFDEMNAGDNSYVTGLLEINDPPPWQPFTVLELVLSAVVVLGVLLPFGIKLRRRAKSEGSTSTSDPGDDEPFNIDYQQVTGKKILLEVDPTSGYYSALLRFMSEVVSSREAVFIFTGKNSALHTAFTNENVDFFLLTPQISSRKQITTRESQIPASDLSVLLDTFRQIPQLDYPATILFDNLSDTILMCGYEKTYKFLRFLLEALSSHQITALFLFNPTAHNLTVSSSIRGLFRYQLGDFGAKSSSAQL